MYQAFVNIAHLSVKELRSLWRDPVMLILIFWAFTFSVITVSKGLRFEVSHASVSVLDEDGSQLSRRIVAAIRSPEFSPPAEISAAELNRTLASGAYTFVLLIPPAFESDLLAGRSPEAQLYADATSLSQAGNGANFLQAIIEREIRGIRQSPLPDPAVSLIPRKLYNPNADSRWFTAIMQIINNITLLSVVLSGASILREREQGTIEHMLVLPITPVELMLSKIIASGTVIITAALASIMLVVRIGMGIELQGSIALFAAGAAIYQASATALGITVATFTRSMAQFGLLIIPIMLSLMLLSGAITPIDSMPGWMATAVQVMPSTQFVSFAQAVLYRSATLGDVSSYIILLAAMGLLLLTISATRLRTWVASVQ